jgi:tryptophanase
MMEDMQHIAAVKDWNEEYFKKYGTFKFLRPDDIVGVSTYMQVAYAGMGWMLIHKGVVENLKYPWFHSELQQIGELVDMSSEDVTFCRALEAAGHPVHLDTKLRVGHQKKMII